jgi:hypothetical protein
MPKARIGAVMHLKALGAGAEPTAEAIAGQDLDADGLPGGTAEVTLIEGHKQSQAQPSAAEQSVAERSTAQRSET